MISLKWKIPGYRKKKLAIRFEPGKNLALLLFDQSARRFESIFIRESSEDTLAANIKTFLGNTKPEETLLVIGRSEIILKEMVLLKSEGIKESFENALAALLPAHKEMAYGRLQQGLLYAVPEKKLREILEFLERVGICVDEIVSEDQCLFWLFQTEASEGPVLIIDKTGERRLFLAVHGREIIFSDAYAPDHEDFESVFENISLSLLPKGLKLMKIIFSGMDAEEREEIAKLFGGPVEIFEAPAQEKGVPVSLLGAQRWGEFPAASLLPGMKKIQKWKLRQGRRVRECILAIVFFAASFSLLCTSHLLFLKYKNAAIERQAEKLTPEISRTREIASSLNKIHEAGHSKERLLDLLKDLAQSVPPAVRLKEFQVEDKNIMLQAESPSHTLLTGTVQIFEKMPALRDVRLEHTRSRKRLNQDFLEFEITGKWRDG